MKTTWKDVSYSLLSTIQISPPRFPREYPTDLFDRQIVPVPTNQEFLDIVLSRTQRQLPTQIRAGFNISRIRGTLLSSFIQIRLPWRPNDKKKTLRAIGLSIKGLSLIKFSYGRFLHP